MNAGYTRCQPLAWVHCESHCQDADHYGVSATRSSSSPPFQILFLWPEFGAQISLMSMEAIVWPAKQGVTHRQPLARVHCEPHREDADHHGDHGHEEEGTAPSLYPKHCAPAQIGREESAYQPACMTVVPESDPTLMPGPTHKAACMVSHV